MADLRFVVPGTILFSFFIYLSVSLFRSNWKRQRTLREQRLVRERVTARLEQERREEEQQARQEYERKLEVYKTLRMEQIMNALKFEVLPDEEHRNASCHDNSIDEDVDTQEQHDDEASQIGNSLAAEIISSERKGDNPECVICLQAYKVGQVLCSAKTERCHHIFHEECAIGWLQESKECPLCRVNLLETAELSV